MPVGQRDRRDQQAGVAVTQSAAELTESTGHNLLTSGGFRQFRDCAFGWQQQPQVDNVVLDPEHGANASNTLDGYRILEDQFGR